MLMLAIQSFDLILFYAVTRTDTDYHVVEIYFPLLKVKAERLPVFNYLRGSAEDVTRSQQIFFNCRLDKNLVNLFPNFELHHF